MDLTSPQPYLKLNATQPVDNYWIRANPSVALANGTGFAGGLNSAILRYMGAPETDPTTNQTPSVIHLLESNLHALVDPAAVSLGSRVDQGILNPLANF